MIVFLGYNYFITLLNDKDCISLPLCHYADSSLRTALILSGCISLAVVVLVIAITVTVVGIIYYVTQQRTDVVSAKKQNQPAVQSSVEHTCSNVSKYVSSNGFVHQQVNTTLSVRVEVV